MRQGGEYQKITVDERTLMAPGVVDALKERLRSGREDIPVIGCRSGSNPGGASHAEVKSPVHRRHRQAASRPTPTSSGSPSGSSRRRSTDNPHVDANYRRRVLDAIPDPQRRKAMKEGDWDVFAGQFFSEWRRRCMWSRCSRCRRSGGGSRHRLRVRGAVGGRVDRAGPGRPGLGVPGALRAGVIESVQARTDQGGRAWRPAGAWLRDPAMWSKTGSAPSPAMAYKDAGVTLEKAVNDRVPGWQRVHAFLSRKAPACAHHRDARARRVPDAARVRHAARI
jgi:hypothetical protein